MTVEHPTAAAERPRHASSSPAGWIRPPRLRTIADEGERRASWLELFFDLVFVVAIAKLSHELVLDPDLGGFLRFLALFVPVFVAWQGFSFYADRFDSDDLPFRLALLAGMLAIATLAVLIPDVWHGHRTTGFALSYIALRAIMIALYARTYFSEPAARPLVVRYGTGYSVAVAIWLVSLLLPEPARYYLWAVALLVDLAMPPTSIPIHRIVPVSSEHVPERWGLFTLIVLGESVVAVALGGASGEYDTDSSILAVLGFIVVAGLWWAYFDGHEGVELDSAPAPLIYSYAHLPLLAGLGAVSAGVDLLIEEAGHDHLSAGAAVALGGGSALFLLALVAAHSVTRVAAWHAAMPARLVAAALCIGLAVVGGELSPLVVAIVLVVILVALAAYEGSRLRGGIATC